MSGFIFERLLNSETFHSLRQVEGAGNLSLDKFATLARSMLLERQGIDMGQQFGSKAAAYDLAETLQSTGICAGHHVATEAAKRVTSDIERVLNLHFGKVPQV